MEKKIDIIPFLAGIVEENTQHYQSDFAYDEKRLQAAMLEISQEDRTFPPDEPPLRDTVRPGTGGIYQGKHSTHRLDALRL